jgi:cation transport ATPase
MPVQALDSNIDSHTLMALAGTGSFLLGLPLEGALLFFLFHFAHVLESKFVAGAERSLEGLLDALPQKVRMVKALADGSLDWSDQQEVPVADVTIGTLLVVKPGEVLPLDGTVVEGSALVGALLIGRHCHLYVHRSTCHRRLGSWQYTHRLCSTETSEPHTLLSV